MMVADVLMELVMSVVELLKQARERCSLRNCAHSSYWIRIQIDVLKIVVAAPGTCRKTCWLSVLVSNKSPGMNEEDGGSR